jgi:NhaA family Na+:H+ antiporter
LAITDDIGGVLVIALFYTTEISLVPLSIGLLLLVVMILLNRIGVRQLLVYAVFGVVVWTQFLLSGVHPTVAGILIAMTIPATTKIDYSEFMTISSDLVKKIHDASNDGIDNIDYKNFQETSETLRVTCRDAEAPLQLAEHALTKWVAFAIIPFFALANSSIPLIQLPVSKLLNQVTIGIIVGLVIGKPLGIISFSWVAIKLGLTKLPEGTNWEVMTGVACLGGIGFTISTFIASLSLSESILVAAKVAILIASFVSGIVGVAILRNALKRLKLRSIPYHSVDLSPPNIIKKEKISEPISES